jgi:hypothetical protein
MSHVVSPRFLFRFAWPVDRCDDVPRTTGRLLNLPERYRLSPLAGLDAVTEFAEWRVAWNPAGLAVSVAVQGKRRPTQGDGRTPTQSDGVQLWIDTRCTQSVHRATRFCHHFCLLPGGEGFAVKSPAATRMSIPQAREEPPASMDSVRLWSARTDDGYQLEAWLPTESLTGFDPESHARLGVYSLVIDAELGEQPLTVGREFPFETDPSLWQVWELRSTDRRG